MERRQEIRHFGQISKMVLSRLKSSKVEVLSFHKSIDSIKQENNRLKATINAIKEELMSQTCADDKLSTIFDLLSRSP